MTLFPSLLHSTSPKFIPHAKTASSPGKLSFNTHVFLRAEALQTIKILVCESFWLLRPPGIQAAKTELSEAWLCHISKFKVLAGTPRVRGAKGSTGVCWEQGAGEEVLGLVMWILPPPYPAPRPSLVRSWQPKSLNFPPRRCLQPWPRVLPSPLFPPPLPSPLGAPAPSSYLTAPPPWQATATPPNLQRGRAGKAWGAESSGLACANKSGRLLIST